MILGLETSCDETAAAVVTEDGEIRSNVVASQSELHARFGGVVPEIASRRHLELVSPVVREALDRAGGTLEQVDRIGVTQGPGLIGALLVGLAAAKGLAWGRGVPLVPVDHLHGHVASLYLRPDPVDPPFLCLLASGGHTLLLDVEDHSGFGILGTTLDDAAGEAFDKGARLLGLGYPGGAEIDRLARAGDPLAYDFPVARVPSAAPSGKARRRASNGVGLDFSFSGLKTALLYAVRDLDPDELERRRADLAASYQRAIVRALVGRTIEAAERLGADRIAIVGGVAANSELRAALPDATAAPLELCTDNAAMIASAARFTEPAVDPLRLDAYAVA
jgi:tRNA N6-adenosine threonylcarbamoyltransferase